MKYYKMVTLIISILGGVLVVIGSIAQWKSKNAEDKINEENRIKIESAQARLIDIQNQMIQKQNELTEISSENKKLQKELTNFVTGGNSKPIVIVKTYNTMFGNVPYFKITFELANSGKYPIHHVTCIINDDLSFDNYKEGIYKIISFPMGAQPVQVSEDELKQSRIDNHFERATLLTGGPELLYTAVYSKAYNQDRSARYLVDIQWLGGHLRLGVNFRLNGKELVLDKSTSWATLNSNRVDSKKYLTDDFIIK